MPDNLLLHYSERILSTCTLHFCHDSFVLCWWSTIACMVGQSLGFSRLCRASPDSELFLQYGIHDSAKLYFSLWVTLTIFIGRAVSGVYLLTSNSSQSAFFGSCGFSDIFLIFWWIWLYYIWCIKCYSIAHLLTGRWLMLSTLRLMIPMCLRIIFVKWYFSYLVLLQFFTR